VSRRCEAVQARPRFSTSRRNRLTATGNERLTLKRQTPAYLPGLDQCSSAVHVILGVHDKHHLVSIEFKSTVQTPGVLHAQLSVPLSPAAHRLDLPHLPAAETTQVPTRRDAFIRPQHADQITIHTTYEDS